MSNRAVIISLIVAVLLGIAAFLLLQPESAGAFAVDANKSGVIPVGERVFEFAPSSVVELRVAAPNQPPSTLRRVRPGAADPPPWFPDAEWILTLFPPSGATPASSIPWPVASAHVQSLLRILSDTRAVSLAPHDAALGDRPVTVTLVFRDGVERPLTLSERTLAGTGLVEVAPPPRSSNTVRPIRALISDELHRVFTAPGPSAWRERALAGPIAADASRVRLANATGSVVLAKVNGQWTVREPVAVPADPNAVAALLNALAKLSVADFLDRTVPPSDTGLINPSATISIESDRRTLAPGASEATVTTSTLTIRLGSPGDAQSRTIFAAFNDAPPVQLSTEHLTALAADASRYVWPYATAAAPQDVHALEFTATTSPPPRVDRLQRDGPRWSLARAPDRQTPLADEELREVEQLLAFLTGSDHRELPRAKATQPGTRPSPDRPPAPTVLLAPIAGARSVGTLDLFDLQAQSLAHVEVSLAPGDRVVLSSLGVHRVSARANLPTVIDRWIRNIVPQSSEPAPVPPPTQPPA